jgi:hypothetical protein
MRIGSVASGALVAIGSSLASNASAQNLLINGDFEQGPAIAMCSWDVLAAGSTSLEGWQITSASIDRMRLPPNCGPGVVHVVANQGEHFVDLDGNLPGGMIRQQVALVPGRRYAISFRMSGSNYCAGNTKRIRLSIGTSAFEYVYQCGSALPQPWVSHEREFVADSAVVEIAFQSLSPLYYCGPAIDDIQLVEMCPADLDQSGAVNGVDLAIILQNWGLPTPKYPQSDINADGSVDAADLAVVLSSWGACP